MDFCDTTESQLEYHPISSGSSEKAVYAVALRRSGKGSFESIARFIEICRITHGRKFNKVARSCSHFLNQN